MSPSTSRRLHHRCFLTEPVRVSVVDLPSVFRRGEEHLQEYLDHLGRAHGLQTPRLRLAMAPLFSHVPQEATRGKQCRHRNTRMPTYTFTWKSNQKASGPACAREIFLPFTWNNRRLNLLDVFHTALACTHQRRVPTRKSAHKKGIADAGKRGGNTHQQLNVRVSGITTGLEHYDLGIRHRSLAGCLPLTAVGVTAGGTTNKQTSSHGAVSRPGEGFSTNLTTAPFSEGKHQIKFESRTEQRRVRTRDVPMEAFLKSCSRST